MKREQVQAILAKARPRPWSTHESGGTTVSAPDEETDVADCAMGITADHSAAWDSALADAAAIAALGNHADALLWLWRTVADLKRIQRDNLLIGCGMAMELPITDPPRDRRKMTMDAEVAVERALAALEAIPDAR